MHKCESCRAKRRHNEMIRVQIQGELYRFCSNECFLKFLKKRSL